MHHYHIQHILFSLQCREEIRRKEKKRKRKLSPKQRRVEEAERRQVHERVKNFIDACGLDEDAEAPAELGLATIFSHDEFVDSRGKPLVKVKGMNGRLFKIRSREYYSYKDIDQRRILHRAIRCHKVKATLPTS